MANPQFRERAGPSHRHTFRSRSAAQQQTAVAAPKSEGITHGDAYACGLRLEQITALDCRIDVGGVVTPRHKTVAYAGGRNNRLRDTCRAQRMANESFG